MTLKTAIYVFDTSYKTVFIVQVVAIGICFFSLHGADRVFTILLLLLLAGVAFYLKSFLIVIYSKRCKYPYEFLSVLRDLGWTDNLDIDWENAYQVSQKNLKLFTKQFLDDNGLATAFRRRSFSILLAVLILCSIPLLLYIYASQSITSKPDLILLISILLISPVLVYFVYQSKMRFNSREPVLAFREIGLEVDGKTYLWSGIKDWIYKSDSSDSSGSMVISYTSSEGKNIELDIYLARINIDRIDLMILLTHFKAYYTL